MISVSPEIHFDYRKQVAAFSKKRPAPDNSLYLKGLLPKKNDEQT